MRAMVLRHTFGPHPESLAGNVASVPGAVQHKRSAVMHRRTGTAKARVVTIPGLQRTTSCCAAPGKQARIFAQTVRMRSVDAGNKHSPHGEERGEAPRLEPWPQLNSSLLSPNHAARAQLLDRLAAVAEFAQHL